MRRYKEINIHEMPEEWKEKIYRNGYRKKVILYDTNMVSKKDLRILLEKIKNVVEYFEKSNEAVLLWCSYSLLHVVLAIEDEELSEVYGNMVERFRMSPNGILDDTSDFYRAIYLSDAYFGDETFLLSLYRQTGKPIMLQNISNRKNTRDIGNLYTEAIVWEGDTGWFFHEGYNALFEADWESPTCKYLASVPGEKMCETALYASIAKYKNYLVLVPYMADEAAIYDISLKTFRKISLRKYGSENIKEKFADCVCYGKYIFFIPTCYPAVVRLDMETLELIYLDECIKELEDCRANPKYLLNVRPVAGEKVFWIGCYAANYLLEFNMETLQYCLHKIEGCQGGITGCCYDGTVFWMLQYPESKIISWNPVTKEEKVYDGYPEGYQEEFHPFVFIYYDGSRVLLLPEHANMILEINPKNGCIHGKEREDSYPNGIDVLYWTYFQRNGESYYMTGDGRIVALDVNLQEKDVLQLQISREEIDIIGQKMICKMSKAMYAHEILVEDPEAADEKIVLESYIKSIVTSSVNRTVKDENMTNGRMISEYIKMYAEREVM